MHVACPIGLFFLFFIFITKRCMTNNFPLFRYQQMNTTLILMQNSVLEIIKVDLNFSVGTSLA